MKTFTALCLAAGVSALSAHEVKYMQYVATYNKVYDSVDEYNMRQALFKKSLERVGIKNVRNDTLMHSGITKFSDWTEEEFQAIMGLKNAGKPEIKGRFMKFTNRDVADSIDWRKTGNVSDVKDQGSCGSCWAFSSTGALESAWSIQKGEMILLSEQQLVDCTNVKWGNLGCNGGWYYNSYDYLANGNTLETEDDYPYTAVTGKTCNDTKKGKVSDINYAVVDPGLELIKAALNVGPVNVAVAAGNNVFMDYTGGIITEADGCPTDIDHAILAVGYGTENGVEYYIVKNSWGTDWGEEGYVRIQAIDGRTGVCGINGNVAYPVL